MSELGTLTGLFRYPVKSMLGEALESAMLDIDGIPGDRAWGVRDERRGDFFVGKRCAELMSCGAWYGEGEEASGVPWVRLPNGDRFRADAEDAGQRIARALGRDVTLWPAVPEARAAQTQPQDDASMADEIVQMMAREDGEPMPDFSNPAPELLEVYARGGPFFDAYPLLLLTRQSLEAIAAAASGSEVDVRRFRPNLLLDAADAGAFPERAWVGRTLAIGGAVLRVQEACVRCVMTTHGFADLPKDPRVMRSLVKEADGYLGVYATVEQPGKLRCGDAVRVQPEG